MFRPIIALLLLTALGTASADIKVHCAAGCIPIPESERTQNLLLLDDDAETITLVWSKTSAPSRREKFSLVAGNPVVQDNLPDLGEVTFVAGDSGFTLSREFRVTDMGKGTFITALLRKKGNRESIAYWRAFRFKTLQEALDEAEGAPFAGAFSLEVIPEYLQVSSTHGELPKHTGGEEKVWWQIPPSLGGLNLDLDGADTGVPGLTVVHSPVWESRGDDWRQSILDNIKSIAGHFVDFDELDFNEVEDRTIEVGGANDTVLLKHYYGVVSLYTNATVRNFTARDLGLRGNRRYFAHETSANFKQRSDPRLWASYSRIEYSADPRLLKLIQASVKSTGTVPGISNIHQDDGDGGQAFYSVAMKARVQPWSTPDTQTRFIPGFVHIDVVASRHGIGTVDTQNELGGSGFCALIDCNFGETRVNLNSPPDDYDVAHPVAILGTKPGTASVIAGEILTAEKNYSVADDDFSFPQVARFALGAQLRAGSLTQMKRGMFSDKPLEMLPINSYAQFVIKYTVAMLPETVAPASDETIVPDVDDVNTVGPTPPPPPNWWEKLFSFLGIPGLIIAGVIAIVVLWVLVPPFRAIFKALANLLAAIIERIAKWVRPNQ